MEPVDTDTMGGPDLAGASLGSCTDSVPMDIDPEDFLVQVAHSVGAFRQARGAALLPPPKGLSVRALIEEDLVDGAGHDRLIACALPDYREQCIAAAGTDGFSTELVDALFGYGASSTQASVMQRVEAFLGAGTVAPPQYIPGSAADGGDVFLALGVWHIRIPRTDDGSLCTQIPLWVRPVGDPLEWIGAADIATQLLAEGTAGLPGGSEWLTRAMMVVISLCEEVRRGGTCNHATTLHVNLAQNDDHMILSSDEWVCGGLFQWIFPDAVSQAAPATADLLVAEAGTGTRAFPRVTTACKLVVEVLPPKPVAEYAAENTAYTSFDEPSGAPGIPVETAPETPPETADTVAETPVETPPETTADTVAETAPDTAPDTAAETAADTLPETPPACPSVPEVDPATEPS